MNKKFALYAAILLVVAGAVFFWPSDEKKIKSNLDSLAEYCSSENQEPVITTLQKAALAAKLCTAPCTVHIASFNIDRALSHKEFTDQFLMMKKRLPNTMFSFHDSRIDIADETKAAVTTTLRLDGETIDEKFTDAYEINIAVEKKDGDWLFSAFTVVEFMKK
ncbi:hypothetical protein FCL47_15980 [Desulfopila sp. IMCC35006]|uniref:hypothetical protein n=1 Tax=Desulfopila sp. IMCC35006 TaxID=2569542 RepID=UPI0010AC7015|nr:hypothetical protein [Desulfopila sp. IMCC35006]TKB25145.1 hypothetical protein FCL47_15980 [Desulfopila sp. IMCC35006]